MNVANTQIQMRKGLLEFCVLHIISRGEVYTSDLIDELTQVQMIVVEGTLYPLLRRLEQQGLLESEWEVGEVRPRKYYRISPMGREVLAALSAEWFATVAIMRAILGGEQHD